MSRTLDSVPAADGFAMPAEWEPHAGCWMAWPERPDNWRHGAGPAQQAFAAVAAAIAEAEPVTVGRVGRPARRGPGRCCPPRSRVVELATDDAWMRDIGPTFVVDGRGGRAAGSTGSSTPGAASTAASTPRGTHDDRAAAAVLEARGRRPLPGAAGARGRVDPRRRRGHAAHHRGVPAQPQPQPVARPRPDRAAPARPHRGRDDHLAGRRRLRGRDRRPHRQPGLLRPARRGGPHLVRRPRRSPARHLARRPPPARGRHRRARAARSRSTCVHQPGPAVHDRRRGGRRRPRRRCQAPAGRRSAWRPATSTSTSPTTGS